MGIGAKVQRREENLYSRNVCRLYPGGKIMEGPKGGKGEGEFDC